MRRLRFIVAGVLAGGLVAGAAFAADPPAKKPTIADLKGRSVDVRTDAATDPGAAQAVEKTSFAVSFPAIPFPIKEMSCLPR